MAGSLSLTSSMDALSSSNFVPRFAETHLPLKLIRTVGFCNNGNLKSSSSMSCSIIANSSGSRILALAREGLSAGGGSGSDDGKEGEEKIHQLESESGSGLVSEGALSFPQVAAFIH